MILPTISFEEAMRSGGQITSHKRHSRNDLYSVHVKMSNTDVFIYTNISPTRLKPYLATDLSPRALQNHLQVSVTSLPTAASAVERAGNSTRTSPTTPVSGGSSSAESSTAQSSSIIDLDFRPSSSLSASSSSLNAIWQQQQSVESFETLMRKGAKILESKKYVSYNVWIVFPADGAVHQFSGISQERLEALRDAITIDSTFQAPKTTSLDDLRKRYSIEDCVSHGAKVVKVDAQEFCSILLQRPEGGVDTFHRVSTKQYIAIMKEIETRAVAYPAALPLSTRASYSSGGIGTAANAALFVFPNPFLQEPTCGLPASRNPNRPVRSLTVPTGVVDFGLDSVHNSKLAGDITAIREAAAMREVVAIREAAIREQQAIATLRPRQHSLPAVITGNMDLGDGLGDNTNGTGYISFSAPSRIRPPQNDFSYFSSPPHVYVGEASSKSFAQKKMDVAHDTAQSTFGSYAYPAKAPSLCFNGISGDATADRHDKDPVSSADKFISDWNRSTVPPLYNQYQNLAPSGLETTVDTILSSNILTPSTYSRPAPEHVGILVNSSTSASSPAQPKEE
ncbi:hypothetical protein SeMB42_g07407 [Synchytrium endobioticum]|uniref:Uncharacterized protein n=1 Tax=Synchytrium endobioticum TaxID=286115 RepID=A0A507C7A3_9FUNG|nr:hypothetical protein SeMB42_g07407 [Synchytrium endobioticum]TPX47068.1 hypothetical protein SeLEV6574_g02854 [Synchytrium endobioticum]